MGPRRRGPPQHARGGACQTPRDRQRATGDRICGVDLGRPRSRHRRSVRDPIPRSSSAAYLRGGERGAEDRHCPTAPRGMIVSLPVRFAHCDPAGIAYFPRLFELVDAAVEEWTAAAVGVARAEMHGPLRLGLPTVDLHATFAAPCRLGETLEIAVAHGEEIGRAHV